MDIKSKSDLSFTLRRLIDACEYQRRSRTLAPHEADFWLDAGETLKDAVRAVDRFYVRAQRRATQ